MKTYDFLLQEAIDAYLLNGHDIKKACSLVTQTNAKVWENRLIAGLEDFLKKGAYVPENILLN